MIIWKSTHELQIKSLLDKIDYLERTNHEILEFYKTQIEDLRKLVFPQNSQIPNPLNLEADSVLNASDKPVEVSEEEHNKLLEQAREVDLLFSGNYSEDLLQ